MDSFSLVIFGVTSNLSQIKLIPALYDMAEKDLLPQDLAIVGVARSPKTLQEFAEFIREALKMDNKHHPHEIKEEVVDKLLPKFTYVDGRVDDPAFYEKLKNHLSKLQDQGKNTKNKIFYLATYPDLYKDIFENLKSSSLASQDEGWVRIMIEKPIGNDLESARELNHLLLNYFDDQQVYRLDHYLGKETVQNILAFRFANGIFEPIYNHEHIDHIQITAAENFGIGKRGGYYDKVGSLKDFGQNHILQMIAIALMDGPSDMSNDPVTAERLKVLKNLIPMPDKVVFGQYEGYRGEENVDPNSATDTFFAFKTELQNERFKGVPIYVRSGKMLKETVTEIAIVFKPATSRTLNDPDIKDEPNMLIYRIQPNEGIVFKILTKQPGSKNRLQPTYMQYCYRADPSPHYLPDPYERLLLDAIEGDQTFFNDAPEIEAEWIFTDPLVAAKKDPAIYQSGSWGPKEADDLIESDGRSWMEPSMDFCKI